MLRKGREMFPRNILESAHIRVNKQRCMNLDEEIGVSTVYGKGKRSLAEEEEAGNIKRRSAVFMIMVVHGQGLRSWLVMVIV